MLVLLFICTILVELLLFSSFLWPYKKIVAATLVSATSFLAGLALTSRWNVAAVIVFFVAIYRVVNLMRIVYGRLHERYLRIAAFKTSLLLGIAQLISLALLAAAPMIEMNANELVGVLVVAQSIILLSVLLVTARNIYKSRHLPVAENYSDKELPTLTIAVPARNETNDLEHCLHSILAGDYPKLEVLVYDDCSQDRTSEVIRKFANKGVRFIKGDPPDERWLAKNYAYSKLAASSSGEYVLFCGVDVRLGPQAARAIVTTLLNRKKTMLSVMPKRLHNSSAAALIQPMRYWWELALPRRPFNRPPALSSYWGIKRSVLKKLGGFEAVSRTILPEGFFARETAREDGYSFIRANQSLDVQTIKSIEAQRETAIRTRYPQVSKRPELVCLMAFGEIVVLLGPFVALIVGVISGEALLQMLSLINIGLLVFTHALIVHVSNPANVPIALVNFPLVVLTELVLGHESMLKYEFSKVDWKGRNICIPVMEVTPGLPVPKD